MYVNVENVNFAYDKKPILHDINFASCYSDIIVALKNGKMYKQGETLSIINNEVLEDLYNTEFKIQDMEDKKICIYF